MRRALLPLLTLLLATLQPTPSVRAAAVAAPPATKYVGLSAPVRVLDSRTGLGTTTGRKSGTVVLDLSGRVTDPGARAVVVSLTALGSDLHGYVIGHQHGTAVPGVSHLSYAAQQTQTNVATIPVGEDRKVDLEVRGGAAHLVVGLLGTWTTTHLAASLQPLAPARAFDSRTTGTRLRTGDVVVSLAGKVPTGASTAVLNLSATEGTGAGSLTAWSGVGAVPGPPSLHYVTTASQSNEVVTALGPGQTVTVHVGGPAVAVVVDVTSGIVPPDGGLGSVLTVLPTPQRGYDTRTGLGVPQGKQSGLRPVDLSSVLPDGATAALVNLTAVEADGPGYLKTTYAGGPRPSASTLSYPRTASMANEVLVPVANGVASVEVFGGATHVVVDVVGYLTADPDVVSFTVGSAPQVTVDVVPVPLRGPTFAVYTQSDDGTIHAIAASEERSYLGTVRGYPGAYVAATKLSTGVFRGEVVFDRGATWFFDATVGAPNASVTTRGVASGSDKTKAAPATYAWPTKPNLTDGTRATQVYAFDEGVDVSGAWLAARVAGDTTKALDAVEASFNEIRAQWLHDGLLMPRLGPVVLRTSAAQDPYTSSSNSTLLPIVRSQWRAAPLVGLGAGGAMGFFTSTGGGLAYVVSYDPVWAFATCDSDSRGDTAVFCRHEMGHNWKLGDNHSGNSEGATVMQGNAYARFGGSETQTLFDSRDTRAAAAGSAVVPAGLYLDTVLPPIATLDLVDAPSGPTVVDVLANDYQASHHAVALTGADPTSVHGGTVARSGGTVTYTPPSGFSGLDSFTYAVRDSKGSTATGVVLVRLP